MKLKHVIKKIYFDFNIWTERERDREWFDNDVLQLSLKPVKRTILFRISIPIDYNFISVSVHYYNIIVNIFLEFFYDLQRHHSVN